MKIETKFDLNDKCYFLMGNMVNQAVIERIETSNVKGQSSVIYTIDRNPQGTQYTKRLSEHEVFKTKQDLLDSL